MAAEDHKTNFAEGADWVGAIEEPAWRFFVG